MPVTVVHLLEMIDVSQDHGKRITVAMTARNLFVEAAIEVPAVEQAGDEVSNRFQTPRLAYVVQLEDGAPQDSVERGGHQDQRGADDQRLKEECRANSKVLMKRGSEKQTEDADGSHRRRYRHNAQATGTTQNAPGIFANSAASAARFQVHVADSSLFQYCAAATRHAQYVVIIRTMRARTEASSGRSKPMVWRSASADSSDRT